MIIWYAVFFLSLVSLVALIFNRRCGNRVNLAIIKALIAQLDDQPGKPKTITQIDSFLKEEGHDLARQTINDLLQGLQEDGKVMHPVINREGTKRLLTQWIITKKGFDLAVKYGLGGASIELVREGKVKLFDRLKDHLEPLGANLQALEARGSQYVFLYLELEGKNFVLSSKSEDWEYWDLEKINDELFRDIVLFFLVAKERMKVEKLQKEHTQTFFHEA